MKIQYRQFVSKFLQLTKFQTLSQSARFVILLHLFYVLADGILNIFVSVYIWKINKNLSHVVWFYFYQSLACLLFTTLAGKLIKRYSPSVGVGWGTFFLALFYFCLLLLQENTIHYIPLLGFIQGIGIIFYWKSFHCFAISFTKPLERNLFNGYSEVSSSFSSLLTPLIAGGMISQLGSHGYIIIFFFSFLLLIVTTTISLFLRIPRKPQQEFTIRPILLDSANPNKRWFWGMQLNFIQGFSDGLFAMLAGVIYFLFVHNEWNLGVMTSCLAILTLISNFLVGRLLPISRRIQSTLYASILHACCAVTFFIFPSWVTVLLFGLGISLFKPWYFVPSLSTLFDYIYGQEQGEELYIEYLVARELALSLGRMSSLLIFVGLIYLLHDDQLVLQWYTLLLSISLPYIGFTLHRLAHSKSIKKYK